MLLRQRSRPNPPVDWASISTRIVDELKGKLLFGEPQRLVYIIDANPGQGIDGELKLLIELNHRDSYMIFRTVMATGPNGYIEKFSRQILVLPGQEDNAFWLILSTQEREVNAEEVMKGATYKPHPMPRPAIELIEEFRMLLGGIVRWSEDGMSGIAEHFYNLELKVDVFIYPMGHVLAKGNAEVLDKYKFWEECWSLYNITPRQAAEGLVDMLVQKPSLRIPSRHQPGEFPQLLERN